MSRLTKYLKQSCTIQTVVRDATGQAVLNKYGEVSYNASQTVMCRKESYTQNILVNNGRLVKSTSRYFVDNSVFLKVDDLIDGNPVVSIKEYINEFGQSEGCEVYV